MRDFTIDNLTETVAGDYQAKAQDPRFRQIITSLITHLHAFAKDVQLTEQEWFEGIRFLTETGQMCDDKRQEFILLSDVLGFSMLIDAINHPKAGVGTESTVLGPFYVEGAPEMEYGASTIKKDLGGEVTLLRGRVTDADGKAIAGATLDVWQNAGVGAYDVQDPNQPEYNLRGKFHSQDDGRYAIVAERPTAYSIPTDGPVGRLLKASGRHGMRPAHVHFLVSAPGFESLTTHVFIAGDRYLDSDAVFATKSSLVAEIQTVDDAPLADGLGIANPFSCVDFDFGLMRSRKKAA